LCKLPETAILSPCKIEATRNVVEPLLETIDARRLTGNLHLQMADEIQGKAWNRLTFP
jgi:hypothetical protein